MAVQLIPEEYEYSSVNGDAFVSLDATAQIKEGSEVRIKVLGLRIDLNDMVSCSVWTVTGSNPVNKVLCHMQVQWQGKSCISHATRPPLSMHQRTRSPSFRQCQKGCSDVRHAASAEKAQHAEHQPITSQPRCDEKTFSRCTGARVLLCC